MLKYKKILFIDRDGDPLFVEETGLRSPFHGTGQGGTAAGA
jgi:hypothetical protein